MQFLALIYSDPTQQPKLSDEEQAVYMKRWFDYNDWLTAEGVTFTGEALLPVATATSLRAQSGTVNVIDGPFAETKEHLGGFYLFNCENLDEALRYAKKCPGVENGCVEVRPVMDLSAQT